MTRNIKTRNIKQLIKKSNPSNKYRMVFKIKIKGD